MPRSDIPPVTVDFLSRFATGLYIPETSAARQAEPAPTQP